MPGNEFFYHLKGSRKKWQLSTYTIQHVIRHASLLKKTNKFHHSSFNHARDCKILLLVVCFCLQDNAEAIIFFCFDGDNCGTGVKEVNCPIDHEPRHLSRWPSHTPRHFAIQFLTTSRPHSLISQGPALDTRCSVLRIAICGDPTAAASLFLVSEGDHLPERGTRQAAAPEHPSPVPLKPSSSAIG